MTPDVIFGIAIAVIAAVSLLATLWPKPQPKSKFFRCARCNTSTKHTHRNY